MVIDVCFPDMDHQSIEGHKPINPSLGCKMPATHVISSGKQDLLHFLDSAFGISTSSMNWFAARSPHLDLSAATIFLISFHSSRSML